MSNIEDIKNSFSKKLDRIVGQHQEQLQAEIEQLRVSLAGSAGEISPEAALERLSENAQASNATDQAEGRALQTLGKGTLAEIDHAFAADFGLSDYYPPSGLAYPTVYCETLSDFFGPNLAFLDISPQMREEELKRQVTAAEAQAKHGGFTFGQDLPGMGCYINGWACATSQGKSPANAWQDPEIVKRILSTAVHEKLGHGFLRTYSAIGQTGEGLGRTSLELAAKFGLREAEEPTFTLRQEQLQLILSISLVLEEGWSTWIQSLFALRHFGNGKHPRYDLQQVVAAIEKLPYLFFLRKRPELLKAMSILFTEGEPPLEALMWAVMTLTNLDAKLEAIFGQLLGQPMRYVIGEQLAMQAEMNLGPACVPYAALIAGNVRFDPDQFGLLDLATLVGRDGRLHPNTRLAALSRLQLDEPNSVAELAERAEAELSFAVPKEIKDRLPGGPHA